MTTRTEYEVEYGIEGSGWTDGDSFDTLTEAEAMFEDRLTDPADPHRFRVVRLNRNVAEYDEDGECVEVRTVETLREVRY